MRQSVLRSVVLFLTLGLSTAAMADKTAHVPLADARKVALAKVPGTIVHEKLKRKKHKAPIYYFKIKPANAAKTTPLKKVEVDGDSGKIVKVKDIKGKDTED